MNETIRQSLSNANRLIHEEMTGSNPHRIRDLWHVADKIQEALSVTREQDRRDRTGHYADVDVRADVPHAD